MIGIFMNRRPLRHIIDGQESYENLEFYRHFVETYEEPLCFYSFDHIDPCKDRLDGYVLSPGNSLVLKEVPLPKHHFCRAIVYRKKHRERVKHFIRNHRLRMYQLQTKNKRNKWNHYQLLSHFPEIRPHLPETRPLTWKNLTAMLVEHQQVVVKPVYGSLGKNVVLIEKNGPSYAIKEKNQKKLVQNEGKRADLKRYCLKKFSHPRRFIVQRRVDADTFQHRIYDCRVSVQKTPSHTWEVTGRAVRLAQRGDFLTNVAQGSDTVSFAHFFDRSNEMARTISHLATHIGEAFAEQFPDTIDLGIDLLLDKNKHVWFIEANLRDLRLSYAKMNDMDMWRQTTVTPLTYIWSNMQSKPEGAEG